MAQSIGCTQTVLQPVPAALQARLFEQGAPTPTTQLPWPSQLPAGVNELPVQVAAAPQAAPVTAPAHGPVPDEPDELPELPVLPPVDLLEPVPLLEPPLDEVPLLPPPELPFAAATQTSLTHTSPAKQLPPSPQEYEPGKGVARLHARGEVGRVLRSRVPPEAENDG